MHLYLRIKGCNFFTFSCHGEDASDDYRASCIYLCIAFEHFGEVLGHSLAYTMVLSFAHGREVSESLDGAWVEFLKVFECLLSEVCELAILVSLAECLYESHVVVVIK